MRSQRSLACHHRINEGLQAADQMGLAIIGASSIDPVILPALPSRRKPPKIRTFSGFFPENFRIKSGK
jgi:hypothetical protein